MASVTWNHRVARRVYDKTIKGHRSRESSYSIVEAYYDKPADKAPHSITGNIDPHGTTLDELRETLVRMLKATYDPVLDHKKFRGKKG
jgi:hypothetical protein